MEKYHENRGPTERRKSNIVTRNWHHLTVLPIISSHTTGIPRVVSSHGCISALHDFCHCNIDAGVSLLYGLYRKAPLSVCEAFSGAFASNQSVNRWLTAKSLPASPIISQRRRTLLVNAALDSSSIDGDLLRNAECLRL